MKRMMLLAAASAVAALLASLPAGAAGSQTYTDPSGDSASAADVGSVAVSNDDAGALTIGLRFANRTQLNPDDGFAIGLDTDRNARTGQVFGAEYLLVGTAEGAGLAGWNGTTYDPAVPQTTLLATSDLMNFRINRSELGNASSFDLFVLTFNDSTEDSDMAPNVGAVWTYNVQLKPDVRSVNATFAPAKPRAGKRFAVAGVRLTLASGQRVAPETKRCTAKLAGKTLRPSGTCAWLVPKTAKGKRLTVSMVVTYKGVTRTLGPLSYKVG
jgi:hypothetical protein